MAQSVWAEVINPYYGPPAQKYVYLEVIPYPANPGAPRWQEEEPASVTIIPFESLQQGVKNRIWVRRFQNRKVLLINEYTNESIVSGSPESNARQKDFTYIFPIPPYEEEEFQAWKESKRAPVAPRAPSPPRAAPPPRQLTPAEREMEAARREQIREKEELRREQQERKRELEEESRRREAEVPEVAEPRTTKRMTTREELIEEAAKIMSMDYNKIQEYFGFPKGKLTDPDVRKKLNNKARTWLLKNYHMDKTMHILGEVQSNHLFMTLNKKLGTNASFPTRAFLIQTSGDGKKKRRVRCMHCGLLKK